MYCQEQVDKGAEGKEGSKEGGGVRAAILQVQSLVTWNSEGEKRENFLF